MYTFIKVVITRYVCRYCYVKNLMYTVKQGGTFEHDYTLYNICIAFTILVALILCRYSILNLIKVHIFR